MSKSITIGARISAELDNDLRKIASATGRSKSWLVAQAVGSYVNSEKNFIEAVEKGLQAMRNGEIVDHSIVMAEFKQHFRAANRKPR